VAIIALAVALAFMFGYSLTMLPILRSGVPTFTAMRLALLSDTASITIVEIVDNLIMVIIPSPCTPG